MLLKSECPRLLFEESLLQQSGSDYTEFVYNFGQDSSFAGNTTAQGNQDSNSIGDFYYEPPTDYLALCTSNLASPEIALPTAHFNTKLYTGDGATTLAVTGVGFQPDFTWIKNRSAADHHVLVDSVRGATNYLRSTTSAAEVDDNTFVASLDADGFTVGDDVVVNTSTENYASWNWKAGGTAVSNTDGTITSSVSANPTAGFSVVGYTGTGALATVGHGLSAAPELVIIKDRTTASTSWSVGTTAGVDFTYVAYLNATNAFATDAAYFNDADPSASVFTIGDGVEVNTNTEDYIAYCFHSIEGYSKVGSYTANGNVDGNYIYTGFSPKFVLTKSSTAAHHWDIYLGNTIAMTLSPNLNLEERTMDQNPAIDYVSNGFKIRTSDSNYNDSGQTYLYIAFAESPFKTSNAR